MAESNTKTAVVTAVLTGVFTVVAGLATYWVTTKEPELSYTVAGGPSLPVTSGTKRIFVVELKNSGKKEIPQVFLQILVRDGELSEIASEVSAGIKVTEEKTAKRTEVRADLLNPQDSVKVSFLASLPSPSSEPVVVVRAPGITAINRTTAERSLFSKENPESLLLLLTTASAAVLSSLFLLTRSKLFGALGISLGGNSLDQSELCAYICNACELHEEASLLRFGGSQVSYRGAADFLLSRSRRAAPADKPKFELALKAMLLEKSLASESASVIRATVGILRSQPFDDVEYGELIKLAVDEGKNPIAWRRAVDSFVRSGAKEG